MPVFDGIRAVSATVNIGADITVAKPTGTLAGDILVAFFFYGRDQYSGYPSAASVTAAGFFPVQYQASPHVTMGERLAGASEPSSYSFTVDHTVPRSWVDAGGVYLVAFKPGVLAYNESYVLGAGQNWPAAAPAGGTRDWRPSPIGFTITGDSADTATASYQDIVSGAAVSRGDTLGGSPTPETFGADVFTGQNIYTFDLLLPTQDLGGGWKEQGRKGPFGHSAIGTFQHTVTLAGGVGNRMDDQPWLLRQVKVTIDPDAVPPPNQGGFWGSS